ncbi:helix-turn-helix domain-containing protein [Nakamurella lactea]|uniref:helix-turn-helix transcriptional regulator n=1 Tax=Nakamurella lactea TaxID=459515 RepID=UPI00040C1E3E|nr:helix-turn-helix transcriptional regulator [Nakamurella lactea]
MRPPRLSGRPLLTNRIDRELFVDREVELRRIAGALAGGLNCAITGEPGMGRTSLLHRALAAEDGPTLLIGGGAVTDATDLLDRIIAKLADTGRQPTPVAADPDPVLDRIAALRGRIGPDRPVIAIDDVPPAAGVDLFGRYRDDLWTVPATWLVTVSSAHAGLLLRPPADVFFEVRIDLPALSDDGSEALLRRRIGDESGWDPEPVVRVAQGNPRRLIALARQLRQADPEQRTAAADRLATSAATLAGMSVPARMLAAELEAVGSASASDPVLQQRLGWTRSRIVQVLKELQAAGLVTATDERSGPGRPRKVYRPTDPASSEASARLSRS